MENITITLSQSDMTRICTYLENGAGEVDDVLMEIYDQYTRQKGEEGK